jgi:hypothetical protein
MKRANRKSTMEFLSNGKGRNVPALSSPAGILTLLMAVAISLSGCATRDGALESGNVERVHVKASPERIAVAAKQAFSAHGFDPVPESTPQELVLRKETPLLFRPLKGGDALVHLVLEPTASGWDVYCLTEPDKQYPGGTPMRFGKVLSDIKRAAECQPGRGPRFETTD